MQVGGKQLSVWPGKLEARQIEASSIYAVQFDDMEFYHEELQQVILEREGNPQYGLNLFRGACGVKVHHVDRWKSPAANLIHMRAQALYSAISGIENPVCDMSWGNVYRNGDYCMPHSHKRTDASVVYHLGDGDRDEENPLGGRLSFADPRIKSCCNEEQARVTTSFLPAMVPGMMIIFPSQLMHYVNPYTGDTPRITLSWNIAAKKIPGSPNPELDAQRRSIEPAVDTQ